MNVVLREQLDFSWFGSDFHELYSNGTLLCTPACAEFHDAIVSYRVGARQVI